MKFILAYVIVLLFLSANEVLSKSSHKKHKKHKKISDGTQIREGSFSKTIQGDIPAVNKMTSTLIISPENEAILRANEPFSVDILIHNLNTGFFSNPDKEYNIKPQSLDKEGIINGHTHVTIQRLDGDQPPDSENFVFFEGLNAKAKKGHLSVDVKKNGASGLPTGRYRICTMSGSFSHQPLVMPVAKRGAQDDCIRIKVEKYLDSKDKPKGKDNSKDTPKGKPKRR